MFRGESGDITVLSQDRGGREKGGQYPVILAGEELFVKFIKGEKKAS